MTEYRNVEEKAQIHRYLQCFRCIRSRQSRVAAYAIGVEVGFGGGTIYICMYIYIYICVYIHMGSGLSTQHFVACPNKSI